MKNRIALVTGAGRGIGRAIALKFAHQGARLAITARSQDQLSALAQEIESLGGETMIIVDDLSDTSAPARIVDQVTKDWGPVEILVNNAGIGSSQNPKPLVDFSDDFWNLTMQVNLTAPYLLTKLILPGMIQRHWGRILNVASIAGKVAGFHSAAYSASKHALIGLTKSTATEVASEGITANAICPGVTRSEMNTLRLEYDAIRLGVSFEKLEETATPLGRRLEPDEVATLAVYLAQDDARGVNGQSINVCGGAVLF